MPVTKQQVMRLLCSLSENKKMRVTFTHSLRGVAITGSFAWIGFLLGGPPGLFVGSSVGGLLGALMSTGQCQSVPQILMELPPSEQQKLFDEFMAIVKDLDWTDAVQLMALVKGSEALKERLLAMLAGYIIKELGAKVSFKAAQGACRSGRGPKAAGLQIEGEKSQTVQVAAENARRASSGRASSGRGQGAPRTNRRRRFRGAPWGQDDQELEEARPLNPEDEEHVVVGAAPQGQGRYLDPM